MGMAAAARLAQRRGLIGAPEVERLEALLNRAGLPMHLPAFSVEEYLQAMGSDKKVKDGKLGFILPQGLGRVAIYHDVTREEIAACLE